MSINSVKLKILNITNKIVKMQEQNFRLNLIRCQQPDNNTHQKQIQDQDSNTERTLRTLASSSREQFNQNSNQQGNQQFVQGLIKMGATLIKSKQYFQCFVCRVGKIGRCNECDECRKKFQLAYIANENKCQENTYYQIAKVNQITQVYNIEPQSQGINDNNPNKIILHVNANVRVANQQNTNKIIKRFQQQPNKIRIRKV